jgi:hypothetical protein
MLMNYSNAKFGYDKSCIYYTDFVRSSIFDYENLHKENHKYEANFETTSSNDFVIDFNVCGNVGTCNGAESMAIMRSKFDI